MASENAVSLKLPTFWTDQPEVWFAQAEAQFSLRRIETDDTKYYYVVAAMDQATATRVLDFVSRPPSTNKYEGLKTRLMDTFGLSQRQRASRLLHFRPLGDSKPSALMDEMLAVVADHTPCFLFEQLFMERLPDDIRIQLVDADFTDLRERADALWSCRNLELSTVNSAVHRRPSPSSQGTTTTRVTQPNSAKKEIPPDMQKDLCYYHRRFGEAARQCRKPCCWSSGNEKAGR